MSDELPAAAAEPKEPSVMTATPGSRSELPEAALKAGVAAIPPWAARQADVQVELARAVLVAATERIECPKCDGKGGRDLPCPVNERGESLTIALRSMCSACAGTGFLYVLKQEKT